MLNADFYLDLSRLSPLWFYLAFCTVIFFHLTRCQLVPRNGITRYFGIMERSGRFLPLILHFIMLGKTGSFDMFWHVFTQSISKIWGSDMPMWLFFGSCRACIICIYGIHTSLHIRTHQQASALDKAGVTYIEAHIKIARMSFSNLTSISLVFQSQMGNWNQSCIFYEEKRSRYRPSCPVCDPRMGKPHFILRPKIHASWWQVCRFPGEQVDPWQLSSSGHDIAETVHVCVHTHV